MDMRYICSTTMDTNVRYQEPAALPPANIKAYVDATAAPMDMSKKKQNDYQQQTAVKCLTKQ